MREALVIVEGVRTPFCKMGTELAGLAADELGRIAVDALLTRTGFDPALVDEVIFGCVCQPVDAPNVARVIALRAGLPETTPAMTVHRNCASGFEAVTTAAERLESGHGSVFIVGGTESMSRVPLLYSEDAAKKFAALSRAKGMPGKMAALSAFRPGDFTPRVALKMGLTDPVSGLNMGETAEVLARECGISRERQDEFALRSHRLAVAARGRLAEEICPVYPAGAKHPVLMDHGPRAEQSLEALARLKPVFDRRHGSVTAGNSSQITDGAVAMLVMGEARAAELGLKPLGRLAAWAYTGCDPARMGLGPVSAIRKLEDAGGRGPVDVDLIEINEAFAAQVLAVVQKLGDVPEERLNVNGGAIALGHPVGATGARLTLTALKELARRGGHGRLSPHAWAAGRDRRFCSKGSNFMENIHSEVLGTGERVLTFDRPDSAANIFDVATLRELDEKLDAVEQGANGVVFISAKRAIFIAGADLHALESLGGEELREFIELGQRVFNRIAALRVPTVAAIHGACVGGGYELCLACKWRIATADRATKIGLPETQLGILPAWGGSTRLPRLIGVPRALDIILGGKTLPAKAALRRGMVDDIAPRELLLEAASKWVQHRSHGAYRTYNRWPGVDRLTAAISAPIARRRMEEKARGHYPALPAALEVVARGITESIPQSLARERAAVLELAATPECRNLIRVFQLQERAKKLRVPGAEKPASITRVAVIGAGVMGAAIAQWLSARGLRVLLRDIDAERVRAGMNRIAALYASAVKRRIIDAKEARDGMDRISPTPAEAPLDFTDLVIEAAVEKMDLKKRIFARLDEVAPPHTLLATNTSALSITELGAAVQRADRVVGIHFFNPVHKMPLVEVITGEKTSVETAAAAVRFVQTIGKLPVLVRDSPGFLVNRILLPYLSEAAELFARGAAIEEVDAAMLDFGMPMGPLRLIDEVGLDVAEDVAATLAAGFPGHMQRPADARADDRRRAAREENPDADFTCHEKGKGRAESGCRRRIARRTPAASLDRAAMQRRMVLLMVNEAARCIEEKVVAEPADVDFGMIMGDGVRAIPRRAVAICGCAWGRRRSRGVARGGGAVWRAISRHASC